MIRILLIALALAAYPVFAQHQAPPNMDPSQVKPLPERGDVGRKLGHIAILLLHQLDLRQQLPGHHVVAIGQRFER